MSHGEIALQLTLAMIEKGHLTIENFEPESVGKTVSKLYNAISQNIDIHGMND